MSINPKRWIGTLPKSEIIDNSQLVIETNNHLNNIDCRFVYPTHCTILLSVRAI